MKISANLNFLNFKAIQQQNNFFAPKMGKQPENDSFKRNSNVTFEGKAAIGDALQQYMKELRNPRYLSRKEEKVLFDKVKQGGIDAIRAKTMIAESQLRFVISIARDKQNRGLELPDLINEGNRGLMRAIEDFDTKKKVKFATYAVWWIKAYIGRAISDTGSTVRIPTNKLDGIIKLKILQKKGVTSTEELAKKLKKSEKKVAELIQDAKMTDLVDLDEALPVGNSADGALTLLDRVSSNANNEHDTEKEQIASKLRTAVKKLPAREAKVVDLMFGLTDDSPRTLRDTGEVMNISRERVRQLKGKALNKLRHVPELKEFLESIITMES